MTDFIFHKAIEVRRPKGQRKYISCDVYYGEIIDNENGVHPIVEMLYPEGTLVNVKELAAYLEDKCRTSIRKYLQKNPR